VSTARLTALRLVGFKSFAERTQIEFGPGISAVVGPNGSGKSNLADALRWTMGEQGRSLRTRRSEDVIFAGSSTRRAIGMADVTLVIDNGDGLLPVEYAEVEIGRRLYRSGENEYLLNRQRIRLRDLVDLLDAANLADNAFLFIGQGMVDQALALRPEERRPLFEEVAGVRRHERRRRHAETELAEAQANLERLRDVLAELRPQARRLAAQAAQLEARRSAGSELAEALVAAARARWVGSSRNASEQQKALDAARGEADAAMAQLRSAEELGERLSTQMGERADHERTRRAELDDLRSATTVLRVDQARLLSELESAAAARSRLADARKAAEVRMREARRIVARPVPQPDVTAKADIAKVERQLAEVEGGLAQLERASDAGAQTGSARTADDGRRLQRRGGSRPVRREACQRGRFGAHGRRGGRRRARSPRCGRRAAGQAECRAFDDGDGGGGQPGAGRIARCDDRRRGRCRCGTCRPNARRHARCRRPRG
jgi:chromosome segregation protein